MASIEYDPNRTTRIALLHYVDGEKRYILAPQDLQVGDMVVSSPTADIKPGNTLPLSEHSHRHPGAQRGDEAGEGRPDGPVRGFRGPVDGQGRQDRPT